MYVRHLTLADFRSWESADLALDPGPVVLVGANGQGKTNLVEALGYLATLGSHRVAGDAPLVRAGAERAVVQAAVVADDRELRVEVEIVAGRGQPGLAQRRADHPAARHARRRAHGAVRARGPRDRPRRSERAAPLPRRAAVARSPLLAGVRADYERVLKQRAALLKSAGGRRGSSVDLAHPRRLGRAPGRPRGAAAGGAAGDVRALRPAPWPRTRRSPAARRAGLRYASSLANRAGPVPGPPAPATGRSSGAAAPSWPRPPGRAGARGEPGRPAPRRAGAGVRELPVRGYASHGEGWSAALALRLGSYELLRSEGLSGGDPVLILDDVFAELDADRRAQLAQVPRRPSRPSSQRRCRRTCRPNCAARFRVAAGTVQRAGVISRTVRRCGRTRVRPCATRLSPSRRWTTADACGQRVLRRVDGREWCGSRHTHRPTSCGQPCR